MTKIAILIGSLRNNSFSEQIAENVKILFPKGYECDFIEIGNLPFYNQDVDFENNVAPEYAAFRNKLKDIDAVLFVTPEYNRTVPAVLTNALDIGSRPKTDSIWSGKPAAIISQSPGNIGGFGANHHLRQILTALNMPVVQQPEVYLSNIMQLLDENGKFNNEGTIQFLQSFIDTFVHLIENNNK